MFSDGLSPGHAVKMSSDAAAANIRSGNVAVPDDSPSEVVPESALELSVMLTVPGTAPARLPLSVSVTTGAGGLPRQQWRSREAES